MSSGGVPLPEALPDSLDRVPEPERGRDGDAVALMLVRVGGRWFSLDARMVQEVAVKGAVTRVPTAARHVLGVAGLRGDVVPVISLEQMIGSVGPAAPGLGTTLPRLVVVRAGECDLALVVDEIRGIIDELPATVTAEIRNAGRPPFLGAEFEWQGKLVCVLDVPQLVAAAAGGSQGGA
jgi:purine-binding chemotaxis protein CheW